MRAPWEQGWTSERMGVVFNDGTLGQLLQPSGSPLSAPPAQTPSPGTIPLPNFASGFLGTPGAAGSPTPSAPVPGTLGTSTLPATQAAQPQAAGALRGCTCQ